MALIANQKKAFASNEIEEAQRPTSISTLVKADEANSDIEKKVKRIICEVLGLDEMQLKPGLGFSDGLGIDSLDIFALLIEMENQFRISITEEEAEKLSSPEALIAFIIRQLR